MNYMYFFVFTCRYCDGFVCDEILDVCKYCQLVTLQLIEQGTYHEQIVWIREYRDER